MLVLNGLKCASCFCVDNDVFYNSNGIPECPHCGGERQVDWSHGEAPTAKGDGYGSFVPVDMGVLGKCETREQYDRACGVIKERFPGHSIQVEGDSAADKKARVDEARHRAWQKQKARGLDPALKAEISADQKRLRRLEPKHEVAASTPAQLVGSGE